MSTKRIGRSINRRQMLQTAAGLAAAGAMPLPAIAQSAKRTVVIWSHFGGTNYEIFNRFIAEFQQTAPDIEIKASSYGAQEILPKYLAAVAAGAPPDIFHAPGYVPPDLAKNNVIIPLDGLVKLEPTTPGEARAHDAEEFRSHHNL
jgi:ABC-type glycerol-3-phosphate transport system substrate-binding protein